MVGQSTLIKLWTSALSEPQSNAPSLPEQINLQGWQFKGSNALPFPNKERLEKITSILQRGRLYQYRRGEIPFKAELWAIQNTNGDISAFVDAYAQQPIALGRQRPDIRYRSGLGFYGIIKTDDQWWRLNYPFRQIKSAIAPATFLYPRILDHRLGLQLQ